jgi:enamine deaminase RidA (YjgF/YER057c/UK114 family)
LRPRRGVPTEAARTLGDVDRTERIIKLFGMVNVSPGFTETPAVIDGCSDLLVQVVGDAGRHTRSAVGLAELPFGIAVEIESCPDASN